MSDIPPDPDPYAASDGGYDPNMRPRAPRRNLGERALFMLLFAVIAHVLVWIYIACCVLQLIVALIEEQPNSELKDFMRNLLAYIGETFAYLGFLQDEKPFPFSPFPHPHNEP